MAAKFGTTVVTVASVGSEDGVHQLLDIKDMKNSPVFGNAIEKIMDIAPKARSGAAASERKMVEEALAPVRQIYLISYQHVCSSPSFFQQNLLDSTSCLVSQFN